MKNILVIGSVGQIGSELTLELRKRYGSSNVVAGFRATKPTGELLESGPSEMVDATNAQLIADVVKKYKIDTIYNLAAILSAVGESKPLVAWNIGIGDHELPRSGPRIRLRRFYAKLHWCLRWRYPLDNTLQDTIMRPQTMYGVSKVAGELLSDYYFKRFGVDTLGTLSRD